MARMVEGLLPEGVTLSVSLDRYQELMHLPINAFNGLNKDNEEPVYDCRHIWMQSERDDLAIYLYRAEEVRERELLYHLSPKYIYNERHTYSSPIVLNRKHLIEVGVEATTAIETVTLVHRTDGVINDPIVLTVTTTVVNKAELVVCYPDEDVRITPSRVTITGGVATIRIPRARLVKPELLDNREDHLYYVHDENFLETVDVKRVYNDPATATNLVWTTTQLAHNCSPSHPNGSETTQTAIAAINLPRANRLSLISIYPATYTNGSWSGQSMRYCYLPEMVSVSYKSGIRGSLSTDILSIKLAHTFMPNMPCTCPYVEQYWREDNEAHPEGLVTPYGSRMGQVAAWMEDGRAKIGSGGMFK